MERQVSIQRCSIPMVVGMGAIESHCATAHQAMTNNVDVIRNVAVLLVPPLALDDGGGCC